MGASIGWDVVDVAAGSVSTSVASVGAFEGVLIGVFGATIGWEFVGMGGKFMGVLELTLFQNLTTGGYTNHTNTEIITTGGANTANAVRQSEILCSAARADTMATAIHTKLINEK